MLELKNAAKVQFFFVEKKYFYKHNGIFQKNTIFATSNFEA